MITKNIKKRLFTGLILLGILFFMFKYNFFSLYILVILSVISLIEFNNLITRIILKNFSKIILNLSFLIYIFSFSFLFFYFSNFLQLKIILYSLIIGCISSDIGGFIFGKILKGPKLTKISPNKTISGVFGSIIFTIIFFNLFLLILTNQINLYLIIVAILISIGCQFGDLFFSFLKRKAKIKDTGNFLPGHGGVLDRLDGIFVGVPIGFISLILLYN
tara:strand:+ start:242 stop:895 length:654 start_codon:yes stop_codon:yes gene_type:complete